MLFSSWYPPVQSGSSFYTQMLARQLRERGHEVLVVTTTLGKWSEAPEIDEGVVVHRLPAWVLPSTPLLLNLKIVPISVTPSNWRRIRSLASEFRPDVIHQVNHIFDTVFLSAALARKTGAPLLCSITTQIRHPSALIDGCMRLVDRTVIGLLAARRWDRIVCLDGEVLRYIREAYGRRLAERGVIIGYGTRDSFYKAAGTIRRSSEGPRQIIMVGHIHELRDPTNLIRAMPQILERFPDIRLVFAGRVQLQRPVQETERLGLTEKVTFLGEVSHEGINRLLAESHIYAAWASGPYTGLGTACIEAMLSDLPVVIDLPEDLFGPGALKDGHNIVLVNRDDPDEIARKILRLFEDDTLRQQIAASGRDFVQEFLSWGRIVDRLEIEYRDVAAKSLGARGAGA
jgi:glycosyltransferase involved in cell wall biosynthesis